MNPQSDTTVIEILELHPSEVQLLSSLRKRFRFGEVLIVMRDGLPVQLKRTVEYENLTDKKISTDKKDLH